MTEVPRSASAVVIGAGIVGNSLVHHLAQLGWRDVVLVDKGPMPNPGGSTGHASNFIFPIEYSKMMFELTKDSTEQYWVFWGEAHHRHQHRPGRADDGPRRLRGDRRPPRSHSRPDRSPPRPVTAPAGIKGMPSGYFPFIQAFCSVRPGAAADQLDDRVSLRVNSPRNDTR
jgi:choline dehydrogenase-like flavoprotein